MARTLLPAFSHCHFLLHVDCPDVPNTSGSTNNISSPHVCVCVCVNIINNIQVLVSGFGPSNY